MNFPTYYDEDVPLDDLGPFAEASESLEGDPLKRYEWAVLLGLDPELALRVASDFDCDLHRAAELISSSCPARLAVELATPVRG